MRLLRFPTLLLLLVLAGGCGGDGGDVEPTASPSEDETTSTTEPTTTEPSTADGPVAGSGASISADDADAWCGAITVDQLIALTGFEVDDLVARGEGVGTCIANFPGADLRVTWGSESTTRSLEKYAASWTRPAGVYDVTPITLANGQEAVLATQSAVRAGFVGTVIDGQLVEATVAAVAADESVTVEDLGAIAEHIVSVYSA